MEGAFSYKGRIISVRKQGGMNETRRDSKRHLLPSGN